MNLKELNTNSDIIGNIKVDFTKCKLIEHSCLGDFNIKTEQSPLDYLQYAKENLMVDNKKGNIDSLCNSKRAIDCQIDCILDSLGYDYKKFEEKGYYSETKKFISEYYKQEDNKGINLKIKFLNVLGLLPTYIIGRIRKLRNDVEHEYMIPERSEVQEAIEVAELFIYSSSYKMSKAVNEFYFGSKYKTDRVWKGSGRTSTSFLSTMILPKFIFVSFNYEYTCDKKIKIVLVNETGGWIPYKNNIESNIENYVSVQDKEFPHLLKVILSKEYKLLPSIFENTIPYKHINISIGNS